MSGGGDGGVEDSTTGAYGGDWWRRGGRALGDGAVLQLFGDGAHERGKMMILWCKLLNHASMIFISLFVWSDNCDELCFPSDICDMCNDIVMRVWGFEGWGKY
jgi:hypothetical protein